MSKLYIKFHLSEPCVDRPSICVKPFISSSVPQLNNESESVSVLESEPLNLAYHLYRYLNMMCHFLISYAWVCPLDVYVSFPGMMQDDKGYIKVNLGITSVQQLTGIYGGISVFCLYTNKALYNIPIGFKTFPMPTCSREVTHLQGSYMVVAMLY